MNKELSNKKRFIKITGTGKYLPRRAVASSEIDRKFSLVAGSIEKKSGIHTRYIADLANGETVIQMAAAAAREAVKSANLRLEDIDCLIFAGAVSERLIPCTAALIHRELDLDKTNSPAYDINSTCISFMTAVDTMSYPLDFGKYRHVLVVSADVPSIMTNPQDIATHIIFGDGAAAAVISQAKENEGSCILGSLMKTYSIGAPLCDLKLGMAHIPRSAEDYQWEQYAFHMDGRGVYKLIGEIFPAFFVELLTPLNLSLQDIDMIIPHQASNLAMQAFEEGLGVPPHKLLNIYPERGNQVAASIPNALHEAITQRKIKRGDTILLLGTSAGVSLAGIVMKY